MLGNPVRPVPASISLFPFLGNWIPSKFLNFIEDNQFVEFRINGSIEVSAET
jgi:hypothetical protein